LDPTAYDKLHPPAPAALPTANLMTDPTVRHAAHLGDPTALMVLSAHELPDFLPTELLMTMSRDDVGEANLQPIQLQHFQEGERDAYLRQAA
jgi:hypothetical protein